MRNRVLLNAEADEMPTPTVGRLKVLWHNWTARRGVCRLADLDDWILQDIGVTRDEIAWVTRLPLDVDPAEVLERLVHIRHEARFRKV